MAVIEFNHVSKSYILGASRTSLREAITQLRTSLFKTTKGSTSDNLFWALNDVSFEVEKGEVLGIIGHNGAGKSTTLKLLSKVTYPTKGSINTVGRMASLIELGAGFHPDLSGRENVYLNGSILGLKRREIDSQFDSIVEFSGLHRFIDTPVKRYSSGMYVRLAFATASHVRADLLLVDEVLSVGDAAFQQKCLAKMRELRDNGATVVFVSHNIWSIEAFCPRVILLKNGKIETEGTPKNVIELYRRQQREALLSEAKSAVASENGDNDQFHITNIEVMDKDGKPAEKFESQGAMRVRIHYQTSLHIERSAFCIEIRRPDGLMCCEVYNPSETVIPIESDGAVEVLIDPLLLVPDVYSIRVRIIDRRQPIVYAVAPGGEFHINGYLGSEEASGVYAPPAVWNMSALQAVQ
jgi:lipopolysaccharide transport system ATP-binding protein